VGGIRIRGSQVRVSQMFLAIDIARFISLSEFRARMDRLIRTMKSTPPAKGFNEVLVAGEPELRMEQERARSGIPVGHGTWHALCQVADRLGVAAPAGREPKPSS